MIRRLCRQNNIVLFSMHLTVALGFVMQSIGRLIRLLIFVSFLLFSVEGHSADSFKVIFRTISTGHVLLEHVVTNTSLLEVVITVIDYLQKLGTDTNNICFSVTPDH